MTGSNPQRHSRPPSFTAADDARRWNHEVIALRDEWAPNLEAEFIRREQLVHASQMLAAATVRQQEDIWALDRERSLQFLHSDVMVATGRASEPISRMRDAERDLSASVDRLSEEARGREPPGSVFRAGVAVTAGRRPIATILAELHRFTHLLGNAMGQLHYQEALRDGYMTFARHLQDVNNGLATYQPPPPYENTEANRRYSEANRRLSVYGTIQPGEPEPPQYRSHEGSPISPGTSHVPLPPLDDPTADVAESPTARRGSDISSSRRSWERAGSSRRPSLQELTTPIEREELRADPNIWRRVSTVSMSEDPLRDMRRTSTWSAYAQAVGGAAGPSNAPPGRLHVHIPGSREPNETHAAAQLFRNQRRSSVQSPQSPVSPLSTRDWFGHENRRR